MFHDAKEYGSILEVKEIDFDALERRIEELRKQSPGDVFEYQYREVLLEKVLPLIKQARIMSQKYDVVCTNPPYMGIRGMNPKLSEYVNNNYPDSKSDMFAVFIRLGFNKAAVSGYVSIITQHSWMFLSSYERLREILVRRSIMYNMLHLGSKAFEENVGTIVQNTAFISRNLPILKYKSTFVSLVNYKNQ